MHQIYIIGHKKPDTDSIGSVIGYAAFLNRNGGSLYVPCRCGDVNPETEFALQTFGAGAPACIESVEPTVSDIPFTYTVSTTDDIPTIEVAGLMEQHDMRNIPITDHEGRFAGLVSEHGLAQAYVRRQKIEPLSIAPISLETLSRLLNGELLVPSGDILEGKVYIAIDALHVTLSRLTERDVAIVGDNEPAQLALISAGIAALIIADSAPAGERVRRAAVEHSVALISTPLDAFGVGKMINLSLPAREVMATDVPTVTSDEPLSHVKQLVSDSRYRTACVVDTEGRLKGMISRNTFLQDINRRVILLDHNEYSQAVDGIEEAEILEVIDHHRIGAITTLKPIRFLNEPVGSTSTIIAMMFYEAGVEPDLAVAGMLLAGVLSDTLVLRLSTTTERDRQAVEFLAPIAGVDPHRFGAELITSGMALDGTPMGELLARDLKNYELFGKKILISQIMAPSFAICTGRRAEIDEGLKELARSTRADLTCLLITSVFEDASMVFAVAEEAILHATGLEEQPVLMQGVMSRKKDFLPRIGQIIKDLRV